MFFAENGFDELGSLSHEQFLGIQDICPSFVLLDGEILSRSLLLSQCIFPPAGLSALPAVGISLDEIIGQKTPSGVADAHGTVNEGFELHSFRSSVDYLSYLFKAKFPCKDYPLDAKLMPELTCGQIGGAGLSADVNLSIRNYAEQNTHDTGIRHKKSIRDRCLLQLLQKLSHGFQIFVMRKDIKCQISSLTSLMEIIQSFLDLT